MMNDAYCFDTNTVIAAVNGRRPPLAPMSVERFLETAERSWIQSRALLRTAGVTPPEHVRFAPRGHFRTVPQSDPGVPSKHLVPSSLPTSTCPKCFGF
jgi:hypothetical protein